MKNNLKDGSRSLTAGLGVLLTVFFLSCNSKTESTESNADSAAATDTSVMGLQGDTTSNSLDAPASAPSDTAAGQNLPEMRATKKE
ncbi:hypothetical protein LX87_02955 [Larkinella arboricola]|uniref:Uncharacterized protein n=1 Tax=Larkinella arboricola TaxID=643671 RepID=A0A327WXL7_LARAB|nr:hypothetical protein [Larkinella arboricola]RAJ98047.1 hypothetical protein LX87_02955 [Larkinella arboricola]